MPGFMKDTTRKRKPPGYYRGHLTTTDVRRAMEGAGPLSLMQIAAMLYENVPPEAKVRFIDMQGKHCTMTMDAKLASGMRRIVQLLLFTMIKKGWVTKYGSRKESKFEWNGEVGKPKQDQA